jgi:hypothetical protein
MKPLKDVRWKPAEQKEVKAKWKEDFETEHYQNFDMHKVAEMVCYHLYSDKRCLRELWDKKFETRSQDEIDRWVKKVEKHINKRLAKEDL